MFQQKPYSAVTATIENLTAETYDDDDDLSGIVELVEAIKLQGSGPAEAARAIRKKLKYGNAHRQVRALVLLDGLLQNGGPRCQRALAADEPLLERLRVCGSGAAAALSDPGVRRKCRELFRDWARYAGTPGMERIARLHKELPKRKVVVTQERSKVIRETEENPFGDDEEEEATRRAAAGGPSHKPSASTSLPSAGSPSFLSSLSKESSSKKSKLLSSSSTKKGGGGGGGGGKRKTFNLEAEKEQMKTVIAESSLASTDLLNALQSINRERERISHNQTAVQRFEVCKQLRRRVLRYIHHVEHEQWLGGLLHANDELVHALMTYEQLDQSIDADSDSDDEIAEQAHLYRMVAGQKGKDAAATSHDNNDSNNNNDTPDLDSLHLDESRQTPHHSPLQLQPPKAKAAASRQLPPVVEPGADLESASEDEDEYDDGDDNNPFADKNVAGTPAGESHEPRW